MIYLVFFSEIISYEFTHSISLFSLSDHGLLWYLYIEFSSIRVLSKLMQHALILIFLTKLCLLCCGNTFFFALEHKSNCNDSLFHILSFFWTYPIYLFIFIWTMLILHKTFFAYSWKLQYFCILLYFNEIFVVMSHHLNMLFVYQNNFNLFLLNYLNKYHPFLFYLNAVIFARMLLSVYELWHIKLKISHQRALKNYNTLLNPVKGLFVISIVLFMGSWWAFQEASWGGWWNWDFSELLGLFFLYILICTIHFKKSHYTLQYVNVSLVVDLCCLLVSYLFLQLNFKTSSHNFGEKFFFFYNNNFLFIELILIIIINLVVVFGSNVQYNVIFIYLSENYNYNQYGVKLLYFLQGLLGLIFLHSFSPLLTNFFWIFCNYNLVIFQFYPHNALLLLFLLILIFFYLRISTNILPLHLILGVWLPNTKIVITDITTLHLIFLWFFLVNLTYYTCIFYKSQTFDSFWSEQITFMSDWNFLYAILIANENFIVDINNSLLFITNRINLILTNFIAITSLLYEIVPVSKNLLVYNIEIIGLLSLYWTSIYLLMKHFVARFALKI